MEGDVQPIEWEPTNLEDKFAFTVKMKVCVVGHHSFNIDPTVLHFLHRSIKKGTIQVTGELINRGAGDRLEIPCKYQLYGPKRYVNTLKKYI